MSGSYVTLEAPEGSFQAYLSRPDVAGSDPVPAVIVLQEIFGVNRFVREACDDLAAHGFIALAPDLFWRQSPGIELDENGREQAIALMQGLDEDLAIADARITADFARELNDCNGKTAALGYCLGGKLAYLMAARSIVDAAVSFYGVGIENALDEASAVQVPLLLHVATDDALCPPPAQSKIAAAFEGRPLVQIETYPAGHAFARTGSAAFSPENAHRANRASFNFLSALHGPR